MLSILIPVYNYDVTELVSTLHDQALQLKIEFEIICLNDNSTSKNPFSDLSNYRWEENAENLGRSATRNKLVSLAKYSRLLFIDADMLAGSNSFLRDYWNNHNIAPVICGGIIYSEIKPDRNQVLRWNYGRAKEVKTLVERKDSPYNSFMTGVFMVDKQTLLEHSFDEEVKQYGHEDTLLGKRFCEVGVEIVHIENPAFHMGLEGNKEFIDKSKQGVQSLFELYSQKKLSKKYSAVIRLYEKLDKTGLLGVSVLIIRLMEKLFYSKLITKGRAIWLFQLLKLKWFVECKRAT